jgi:hypothetical protein
MFLLVVWVFLFFNFEDERKYLQLAQIVLWLSATD